MALVTTEIEEQIATITITNGKVNAISHQVIDELNAALDQAEQEKAVVILTGQPGILSGGYDLKTMKAGPDSAIGLVTKGSNLARRMLAFPYPIIVACSGHAVAKGAFILLSCDYRIGCDGDFKIGLNEVAIGMTMHNAGIEIAQSRIPINYLNRSVNNAEMFDPKTAIKAGFLDIIVAPEQLMATAKFTAEQMKKLDMTAHIGTKLKQRKASLAALDQAIEVDANLVINL
ncbi:crotonase/enoyl-CoA hydratase family protein [Thalassotalea atypica]|uniref:crotonase/enoyl-CoA hydratase family protein n=1 Tax=Thalassotalea atypica TaxID=2054316 RepID=UPI002572995A|nr:crotonase/enoyl-CoA hydratase family protein [Thalassotalea atypica]